jgi:predicted dehydrogenase
VVTPISGLIPCGFSQQPAIISAVSERARIGLVGCGRWGSHILHDLTVLGCEVTVVARSERSKAAAEEAGASIAGSLAQLPAVEGIVVATPISTHAEVVGDVLGRGVPVFVEKPLTDDAAAADRLAAEADRRLFVMDKWRYHPGVELLGEIARSGELGAVVGLRTTRTGWERPRDVDFVWVLAPHDLAIALEVLGELPAPQSAVGSRNDLVGLLGPNPWQALEVSGRSHEQRREVALVCEQGIAVLEDSYDGHVSVFRGDGGARRPAPELRPVSTELPLLRELRAFVEHLRGGPPPRSAAREGAAIVRALAELRTLAGIEP